MSGLNPHSRELTLALVGKRSIDTRWRAAMERDLVLTFDALASGLDRQLGGATLILNTGLADGADQVASELFLAGGVGTVRRVLGAILPCPAEIFALNGPVENLDLFSRTLERCTFITVLERRLPPPPPDRPCSEPIRQVRRETFAAQADALLGAADILVAVDDPNHEGDVGGTRHTLGRARARGLPVVLIELGRDGVSLPQPPPSPQRSAPLRGDEARAALVALARNVTRASGAIG